MPEVKADAAEEEIEEFKKPPLAASWRRWAGFCILDVASC